MAFLSDLAPIEDQVLDSTTPDQLDDEEKKEYFEDTKSNSDSSKNVLDEASPIVYHYLTFDTLLPHSSRSGGADVPPPDLRKFQSPFLWSKARKNFTVWVSCIATCIAAYTAGSYSPAAKELSELWGVSQIAIFVGITTFCCGL